jgi:hypothetical protein
MTGMQDTSLSLRDTLQAFMNSPEFSERLKKRWLVDRKLFFSTEAVDMKIDQEDMLKTSERVTCSLSVFET